MIARLSYIGEHSEEFKKCNACVSINKKEREECIFCKTKGDFSPITKAWCTIAISKMGDWEVEV